jgi:hypothetical protein
VGPGRSIRQGVKTILRYVKGTEDLGLFFQKNIDLRLVGYANAGYLSDPHDARSQTSFVFFVEALLYPGHRESKL